MNPRPLEAIFVRGPADDFAESERRMSGAGFTEAANLLCVRSIGCIGVSFVSGSRFPFFSFGLYKQVQP